MRPAITPLPPSAPTEGAGKSDDESTLWEEARDSVSAATRETWGALGPGGQQVAVAAGAAWGLPNGEPPDSDMPGLCPAAASEAVTAAKVRAMPGEGGSTGACGFNAGAAGAHSCTAGAWGKEGCRKASFLITAAAEGLSTGGKIGQRGRLSPSFQRRSPPASPASPLTCSAIISSGERLEEAPIILRCMRYF